MKIRLLIAALLAALAIASGLQAQGGDDHTELGATMEKMGKAWRKAKPLIPDTAKNADALEQLTALKTGMETALKYEPAYKAKIPAADQAKFMADYQAKLKEEIARVDEIITLIKAGKNAEAAKLIPVVDAEQKKAHTTFKEPKKKKATN